MQPARMAFSKLLVVDDDAAVRRLMGVMLERVGYEVVCADSAEQASKFLAEAPFDLIITDVLMPGRDGIQFITDVRKKYGKVKIIAASGGGLVGPSVYLQTATALGADAILPKPFTLTELLGAIEHADRKA